MCEFVLCQRKENTTCGDPTSSITECLHTPKNIKNNHGKSSSASGIPLTPPKVYLWEKCSNEATGSGAQLAAKMRNAHQIGIHFCS